MPAADGLLSQFTVLDLTEGAAGPFCTKLFADFGARVIKVERPGRGDPARRVGPFPVGHDDAGALFLFLNTGKESLTLDLSTATGRSLALDLVAQCDAVIESYPTGHLDAIGLAPDVMRARNPRIVVTSVSAFGHTGRYARYRATDLTSYASGGQMSVLGDPDREPLMAAGYQAAYQNGVHAFGATLAGLFAAGTTGSGQDIEVAAMECMVATLELLLSDLLYRKTDILSKRRGNIASATLGIFPAADGYVGIHAMARNFPAYARAFDAEWMLQDERFRDARARLINNDEMLATMYAWAASITRDEAYALAGDARVTIAPVLSIPDVMSHPHLQARQSFRQLDDPRAGELTYPGPPFRTQHGDWELRPAPRLGQHNNEIFIDRLGLSKHDLVDLRSAGVI